MSVAITNRWADDGITSKALMPGGVMSKLVRNLPTADRDGLVARVGSSMKTPEQGAATSVLLATSRPLEGIGGR